MSKTQTPRKRRGPGGNKGPMPIEKAKNFKESGKRLLSDLASYKGIIISVFILAIGSAIFSILGPKILGNATTLIFEGLINKIYGTGSIDFIKVRNTVILLFILYLVSCLFTFIQGILVSKISNELSYNLRKKISIKLNNLPMKYFDKYTNGDILSRITNDVDTLSQNLSQSLTQAISSVVMVVGILIMMFSISATMTFSVLLVLPITLLLIGIIVGSSQKYFTEVQDYLGDVNGIVEENFAGHNIIKLFNNEDDSIKEFNDANNLLCNSAWKSQFISGIMHPIMIFIGNLGYVIVSILGGYLVIKEKIKVGDIQSFIQYVKTFTNQLSSVTQIANLLQSTVAAAERVYEFLDEEEEVKDTENPVSIENINSNITFSNVKFGYDEDKIIINDFSVDIKSGAKIAIVGPTGAGKTTIVKLLMRFYDINSGSIKIDGHDLREFKRDELRSLFGMVLQDTWLFNGTIKDNIAYGKKDATLEEVIKAADVAMADHFIRTLPGGYDMVINEEANNISQGQKQLLTIARVVLYDPKILILDEATSSVDTRTEVLIQEAMDKLMEGRTSFIIAHRLSTIRNADLILVMDHGDIVEIGNHDELLNKNGFYANLYNSQFESTN